MEDNSANYERDYKYLLPEFTKKSQVLNEIKKAVDNGHNDAEIVASVKKALERLKKSVDSSNNPVSPGKP